MRNDNGSLLYYEGFLSNITDRTQAEHAIVKSEQRYRSLMENAADAIFLMDQQLMLVDINSAGCELSGYTRTELLAMAGYELLEGSTPEEASEARDQIEPNVPPMSERLLRRKDGSTIPIENRVNLIELGETSYYLAMTRDITERKVAEREFHNREMHFRHMAEENSVMAEIGRIIESYLDISEVYNGLGRELRKLVPFDRIVISLANLEQDTPTNAYVSGWEIPGREAGHVFKWISLSLAR